MSNQLGWEKIDHIVTLYRLFCENCNQQVSSKNGIGTKSHNCRYLLGKVSPRASPFCVICMGWVSSKPKKLQLHCISHSPIFNQRLFGAEIKYSPVLFDLLSSNFENIIASYTKNFDRSNGAIAENLTETISPRFEKVRVYTYGSREIGTAGQSSDLDLYVDTDQSYHIHGLDKSVMTILEEVADILKDNPDTWEIVNIIKAKTPIIQVYNKIEDIRCDISFSDGLGHSNTQLIKKLCDIQPIFRDMIIFLGHWLDTVELSTYITKYALRLLIMNYLQCKGLLPSIRKLQRNISKPTKIGEWIVDYDESKIFGLSTKNRLCNLEQHIKGFFKIYSKTKTFRGIISTYLGTRIPCQQITSNHQYNSYNKFIMKYGSDEAYKFSAMNVQEPFNLAANPAKKVSTKHLEKFIKLSRLSCVILNMENNRP